MIAGPGTTCEMAAVVTGSTSGIGHRLAARLLNRDDVNTVVVTGRTQRVCDAVAEELRQDAGDGKEVVGIAAELSEPAQVKELARKIQEHLQGAPVDWLFLNAGMTYSGLTGEATNSQGNDLLFSVNCAGPFLLAQLLLDDIQRAPQGRVVFTSSVLQYGGDPTTALEPKPFRHEKSQELEAYGNSKLALGLFGAALGEELRETRVQVRVVAPGMVATSLSVPHDQRHLKGGAQPAPGWRRFSADQAAEYIICAALMPGKDLHLRLLGPYRLPEWLCRLETPSLPRTVTLWLLENLQKLTARPGQLFVWPQVPAMSEASLQRQARQIPKRMLADDSEK